MAYEIERVTVWAGEIEAAPGSLARKLGALREAGANLEFVIVRPLNEIHGVGVLYVAPLLGPTQEEAGVAAGLHRSESIPAVRLGGANRPGLVAEIAEWFQQAEIHVCGVSAAVIGERCVMYLRFETKEDAETSVDLLRDHLA